jgi:Fe-S-cluster containining protein
METERMACPTTCLCDQCAALCCRYFALPIDNPKTAAEYDNVRWYLMHESVVVFVEKKQWYLGVMTRCKNLQPDNRCAIYDERPRICRSYSTDNCDYHGGEYDYDLLFTSSEQLKEYAEKKLGRSLLPRKRRKPVLMLPSPQTARVKPKPRQGLNGKVNSKLNGNRNGKANGHAVLSLPVLAGR